MLRYAVRTAVHGSPRDRLIAMSEGSRLRNCGCDLFEDVCDIPTVHREDGSGQRVLRRSSKSVEAGSIHLLSACGPSIVREVAV